MAKPADMDKYLRLYAEQETQALESLPGVEAWSNVLVIPACNETAGFLRAPPRSPGRSLLILVVNESPAASAAATVANRALAARVRSEFESQWRAGPGSDSAAALELLRDPARARDVLLVDRFSAGRQLPRKGGVGLARKIGADLAASLIHRRRVHSRWIHCSDADVRLPDTYFDCSPGGHGEKTETAALVYPFRHCQPGDVADREKIYRATQLYERSLRYYVAGLEYAGSPYAFHTIGSTMAVSAVHYARVRGFPRREAAEDFYLLNKLAKVGRILQLEEGPDCEALAIESRRSDRVPFGTGAAVSNMARLQDLERDFRVYHPGVFVLLKAWLDCWPALWRARSTDFSQVLARQAPGESLRAGDRDPLVAGLEAMNTGKALDHAFRQSGDARQFMRQMHTWFDGFRTLKLIHFLRDKALPSVCYRKLGVLIPESFPRSWDIRAGSG